MAARVWKIYWSVFCLFCFYLSRVRLTWPLRCTRVHGKENDSELSDKTGGRPTERWVLSERTNWFVAVCHSNLGDSLILSRQHEKYSVLVFDFQLQTKNVSRASVASRPTARAHHASITSSSRGLDGGVIYTGSNLWGERRIVASHLTDPGQKRPDFVSASEWGVDRSMQSIASHLGPYAWTADISLNHIYLLPPCNLKKKRKKESECMKCI